MSSSPGAAPLQLQLHWASSLDALLADLPDGWLKTQAHAYEQSQPHTHARPAL